MFPIAWLDNFADTCARTELLSKETNRANVWIGRPLSIPSELRSVSRRDGKLGGFANWRFTVTKQGDKRMPASLMGPGAISGGVPTQDLHDNALSLRARPNQTSSTHRLLSKCLLPMHHVNATTASVHERTHAPCTVVVALAIPPFHRQIGFDQLPPEPVKFSILSKISSYRNWD